MMSVVEIPGALMSPGSGTRRRRSSRRFTIVPEVLGDESSIVEERLVETISELVSRQEQLERIANTAGLDIPQLLALLEAASAAKPESKFTKAEVAAFADAGVTLTGPHNSADGLRELLAGRAASHALITTGLSVEEAAERLGVTRARVRQRITEGEILTIRLPEGHVLPSWQFVGDRVVPGLAHCAPSLSALHPLEVAGFMTRPCSDLLIDETPTSPRDWLLLGGDPRPVTELVAALVRS